MEEGFWELEMGKFPIKRNVSKGVDLMVIYLN